MGMVQARLERRLPSKPFSNPGMGPMPKEGELKYVKYFICHLNDFLLEPTFLIHKPTVNPNCVR